MKKYYIRRSNLGQIWEYRREKQYKSWSTTTFNFELNVRIHEMSIRSAEWIFDRHHEFNEQMRDSIGTDGRLKYGNCLGRQSRRIRSLPSGLIELIANEDLVKGPSKQIHRS